MVTKCLKIEEFTAEELQSLQSNDIYSKYWCPHYRLYCKNMNCDYRNYNYELSKLYNYSP